MQTADRLERRHIVLLALLSTATFFEGYDFILLNLVLPYLQKDFHLTLLQTGYAFQHPTLEEALQHCLT